MARPSSAKKDSIYWCSYKVGSWTSIDRQKNTLSARSRQPHPARSIWAHGSEGRSLASRLYAHAPRLLQTRSPANTSCLTRLRYFCSGKQAKSIWSTYDFSGRPFLTLAGTVDWAGWICLPQEESERRASHCVPCRSHMGHSDASWRLVREWH